MRFLSKLKPFFIPAGLLLIVYLAYGVLAPWLGFYLDDWYIVWINKMFGASRFVDFFKGDRPLFAYVYMTFVPIFKDSALAWQLFAVFTRWIAVCLFYYLLRMVFPKNQTLCLAAAGIFAVYPGFQFHWFSVQYSQVYFLMALYFTSYILMILAVRATKRKALLFIAAVICQLIGIAPMEYFYGLELFRPILLYIVLLPLFPDAKRRVKRTFFYWLPFLLTFVGFTIYRLIFSGSYMYQVNLLSNLRSNFVPTLQGLFLNVYHGITAAVAQAWLVLPDIFIDQKISSSYLLMIGLFIFGSMIAYLLFANSVNNQTEPEDIHNARALVWAGLFISIIGMIPFIVGGFAISLNFPENRYLLSMAPGVAMFTTGIAQLIIRRNQVRNVLLAALIGLSIGSQFHTAKSFMLYWNEQKDFFEQLAWRIPAMEPDTILITDDLSFSRYFSGQSLSAPLNLTYAPEIASNQFDYFLFLFTGGQAPAIPQFQAGLPVSYSLRSLEFNGSTSAMIAFYKPDNTCLRVLSNQDTADQFSQSPRYSTWSNLIPLSNLDQIITSPDHPAVPPVKYFGVPDTNQWCYYFEKADLARQEKDWQKVIELYAQSDAKGFHPGSPEESLPRIDALIHTGQIDQAIEITRSLMTATDSSKAVVCDFWQKSKSQISPNSIGQVNVLLDEIGCTVGS